MLRNSFWQKNRIKQIFPQEDANYASDNLYKRISVLKSAKLNESFSVNKIPADNNCTLSWMKQPFLLTNWDYTWSPKCEQFCSSRSLPQKTTWTGERQVRHSEKLTTTSETLSLAPSGPYKFCCSPLLSGGNSPVQVVQWSLHGSGTTEQHFSTTKSTSSRLPSNWRALQPSSLRSTL